MTKARILLFCPTCKHQSLTVRANEKKLLMIHSLSRQWSVGDIFQGFEFEVPIPPERLESVPTPPEGCYRLVKAGDGQPDEQSDDGQPDEQRSTDDPGRTTDMENKKAKRYRTD